MSFATANSMQRSPNVQFLAVLESTQNCFYKQMQLIHYAPHLRFTELVPEMS